MKLRNSAGIRRIVIALLLAILVLGLFRAVIILGAISHYELSHPYWSDLHFFMAVGRGILNGLIPYADLFETKPPGIFLISAFSLALSGDMTIAFILETVAFVAPAVLGAILAYRYLRPSGTAWNMERLVLFLTFLLYALLLSAFHGFVSGSMHPETFGGALLALYGMLVLTRRELNVPMIVLLSILLLSCVMLKEPFLPASLAVGLLVSGMSWRKFIRAYVIPLILGGIIGVILLAAFGYLGPYLGIYLPEIYYGRAAYFLPTWMSMLQIGKIVENIADFSPFLAIVSSVLLLLTPALWMREAKRREKAIVTFLFFISAALISWASVPSSWILNGRTLSNAMLYFFGLVGSVLLIEGIVLRYRRANREAMVLVASWLIPLLMLLSLSIALGAGGDFRLHHTGTVVPFFYLLAILAVRELAMKAVWSLWVRISILITAVLLSLGAFTYKIYDFPSLLRERHQTMQKIIEEALVFDQILDTCGEERYLIVGEIPLELWAFTRHSPLGPGFFQYYLNVPNWWHVTNQLFVDSFHNNLRERANIVVTAPGFARPPPEEAARALRELFTEHPWPCAEGMQFPKEFQVLFRKDAPQSRGEFPSARQ